MITVTKLTKDGRTVAISFDDENADYSEHEIHALAGMAVDSVIRQCAVEDSGYKLICGGKCTDAGH